MIEFITLTCPTCGSRLKITKDIDRFACESCGNEHLVKRDGGVISIAPVLEELKDVGIKVERVQQGIDKTVSELAIRRVEEDIDSLCEVRDSIKPQAFVKYFGFFLIFTSSMTLCGAGANGSTIIMLILGGGLVLYQSILQSKKRQPYIDKIKVKRKEFVMHKDILSID